MGLMRFVSVAFAIVMAIAWAVTGILGRAPTFLGIHFWWIILGTIALWGLIEFLVRPTTWLLIAGNPLGAVAIVLALIGVAIVMFGWWKTGLLVILAAVALFAHSWCQADPVRCRRTRVILRRRARQVGSSAWATVRAIGSGIWRFLSGPVARGVNGAMPSIGRGLFWLLRNAGGWLLFAVAVYQALQDEPWLFGRWWWAGIAIVVLMAILPAFRNAIAEAIGGAANAFGGHIAGVWGATTGLRQMSWIALAVLWLGWLGYLAHGYWKRSASLRGFWELLGEEGVVFGLTYFHVAGGVILGLAVAFYVICRPRPRPPAAPAPAAPAAAGDAAELARLRRRNARLEALVRRLRNP